MTEMATKVLMDVEEYLRTSFEGADCEYVDGEIMERNMGEWRHGELQGILIFLLLQMAPNLGLKVIPEIRIRINPRRYRIPDIGVWRASQVGQESIPTVPPFLAIEILSPDDRMVRMQPKIAEYLAFGVEWVWLIDPREKMAICYSQKNPAGSPCATLRTENPLIEIPLEEAIRLGKSSDAGN